MAGSAAVRLGTDEAFMSKLADWCKNEDHEGVRGRLSQQLHPLHVLQCFTDMQHCMGECRHDPVSKVCEAAEASLTVVSRKLSNNRTRQESGQDA